MRIAKFGDERRRGAFLELGCVANGWNWDGRSADLRGHAGGDIVGCADSARLDFLRKRQNGHSTLSDLPGGGDGRYQFDVKRPDGDYDNFYHPGPKDLEFMESEDRKYLSKIAKSNPLLFLQEMTPVSGHNKMQPGLDLTEPLHCKYQEEFQREVARVCRKQGLKSHPAWQRHRTFHRIYMIASLLTSWTLSVVKLKTVLLWTFAALPNVLWWSGVGRDYGAPTCVPPVDHADLREEVDRLTRELLETKSAHERDAAAHRAVYGELAQAKAEIATLTAAKP
jgi:hypothetical protein